MVKPYNFLCKSVGQSRQLFSFFPQIPPFFPQKRHCSQNVHVFFKIRSTFSPLSMVSYGCRQEVTKNSFFSLLSLKGNTRCSEGRTEQRVLLFFFLSSFPSASAQTIPSLQPPGKEFFEWLHSCVQLLPCGDGSNVTQIQLRCNGLTEGYAIHHDNGNGPYTCDYLCLVDYLNKSAPRLQQHLPVSRPRDYGCLGRRGISSGKPVSCNAPLFLRRSFACGTGSAHAEPRSI